MSTEPTQAKKTRSPRSTAEKTEVKAAKSPRSPKKSEKKVPKETAKKLKKSPVPRKRATKKKIEPEESENQVENAVDDVVKTSAEKSVRRRKTKAEKTNETDAAPVSESSKESDTKLATSKEEKVEVAKKPKKANSKSNVCTMEKSGIGINMPRVKKVLTYVALNNEEYLTKEEIDKFYGKRRLPKPTSANDANAMMSPAITQKPLELLDPQYLVVLNRAREHHENNLLSKYESDYLKKYSDDKRAQYNEELKAAKSETKSQHEKFNKEFENKQNPHVFVAKEFNLKFDGHFYDEYNNYKQKILENSLRSEYEQRVVTEMKNKQPERYKEYLERKNTSILQVKEANNELLKNDSTLSKAELPVFDLQAFNTTFDATFYNNLTTFKSKSNPWSEAKDMVGKLCIRVSLTTRVFLAAFLDQIVLQYVTNAIFNCAKNNQRNIGIVHAFQKDADFDRVVPLDKFVRTLDTYKIAQEFIAAKLEKKNSAKKAKDYFPKYINGDKENPVHVSAFDSYINDICKWARKSMADSQRGSNDALAEQYASLHVSNPFKRFCSYIVHETIVRIGCALKIPVNSTQTKTISKTLIEDSIKQLHAFCGISYTPIYNNMITAIAKYKKHTQEKRLKGKQTKAAAATGVSTAVTGSVETKTSEASSSVVSSATTTTTSTRIVESAKAVETEEETEEETEDEEESEDESEDEEEEE
jgi:hypothetical protein